MPFPLPILLGFLRVVQLHTHRFCTCFPQYVVSIDISVDDDGESWEFSSQFTAVLVHDTTILY